jgi:hypothetical protein
MKDETTQSDITYESPAIEDLGSLTELTAGGKYNSLADLQSGQINAGGPGS